MGQLCVNSVGMDGEFLDSLGRFETFLDVRISSRREADILEGLEKLIVLEGAVDGFVVARVVFSFIREGLEVKSFGSDFLKGKLDMEKAFEVSSQELEWRESWWFWMKIRRFLLRDCVCWIHSKN